MIIFMTKDASPTIITDVINEFLEKHSQKILAPGVEKMLTGILYMHPDLYEFSKQAEKEGLKEFYVRPVDPKRPYGKQERCQPEYSENVTFPLQKFSINLVKDKEELNAIIKLVKQQGLRYIDKGEAIGVW